MTLDTTFIFNQVYPFLNTAIGISLFISLYAIWICVLLPGSWLSMFAGFIYGPIWGTCWVFIGAFFGAQVSFLLSRKFFRAFAQKRISKYSNLNKIQKAVSKKGLKLIILTRLSPAFPFSILNLIYGLSDVNFKDYSLGLFGILPGTIFFCGIGALAEDFSQFAYILSENNDLTQSLLQLIGLFSTLAVVWILVSTAKKELQELE